MNPALLLLLAGSFAPVAGVQVHCAENIRGRIGRARVEVVVGSGALSEPESKHGVAHLLEHMLLRPLGYDHNNGETSWDHTRYFSDVRADALPDAAARLLNALSTPVIDPGDLEVERRVVIRELVDRGAAQTFTAPLFEGTGFDRPLGGTEATLRDIDAAALQAFHRDNYTRGNVAVLLLGATSCVDLTAALEPELARFSEGPAAQVPPEVANPPGFRSFPGGQGRFVGGFYWYESNPHDQIAARIIAKHLEQQAFSELREKLGITYSPQGHFQRMADAGFVAITVTADEEGPVEDWFAEQIAYVRSSGEPRTLMGKAVVEIKRSLETPTARDALSAIRGEPDSGVVLRELDDARFVATIDRLLDQRRQFFSTSGGAGEGLVLIIAGLVVLGFCAWLARSLLRGG